MTNIIFLFILNIRGGVNIKSVQNWVDVENIYEDGIIKLKNKKYIKIIEVIPINYNLKSELEKESILNSYKQFLKSCNFDIQILIQSSKEDLTHHIKNIKSVLRRENLEYFFNISENYIDYIINFSQKNKSSTKKFFIITSTQLDSKENIQAEYAIKKEELQEQYFKIKTFLSRIGNTIIEKNSKEKIIEILKNFQI